MRILIIGGTRFIGPHIVRSLSNEGHEITLFHRGKSNIDFPNRVKHILGDRKNITNFKEQFRDLAPRLVLDMFPITEQDAKDLMNIFTGIAKRIVAISSQDVYRAYGKLIGIENCPIEPIPLNEDSALREKIYPYRDQFKPDNKMYYYDKILVERVYMSSLELPSTILRFPMVYGPGDYQHRLFPYLKRMDDKRPIILLEKSMANWQCTKGYVEDVANAVVLVILNERAKNRIYNVGDEESLTEADWVKAIGAAAGWKGKVVTIPKERMPDSWLQDVNTAQHLVTDTSRIREELEYRESVSRDDALRRTIEWERKHLPEKSDPKVFDYEAEDALLTKLK
jgi:nucleoside-diphosphate-sugar epimerase